MQLVGSMVKRGIKASSFHAENIEDVEFSSYDLVILTSSWDDRCTTLTQASLGEAKACILLLFDDKDTEGIRDRNDDILSRYSSLLSKNLYVVKGLSTDVDGVWQRLFAEIINVYKSTDKPLSILFDLSCCPRFYSLTTLSVCFKYGLAGKFHFFYNECTYPEKKDDLSMEEVPFTAGRWEARIIEHLAGSVNPGDKNRFTVSIGFEGSKTLMVLNEFEPDKVNVIIPCPGYTKGYADRVREANIELFKSFGIKRADEQNSHAGDPVSVWSSIQENHITTDGWNDYFLCAGSKPHSLGLALAALSMDRPRLIYSLPKKHNPVTVIPKQDCWLYSVENIVVPLI